VPRFFIETLGCPKNQVDSAKLVGSLVADGMERADDAESADLVVVNTCAFIDAARQESIDTVLALDDRRPPGSRLVVTGCLAERYGTELAEARDLSDQLVDAICATGVPYFDLSLQHVSKPLLRRIRRWGDGDRFLRRINDIRDREPAAAFRSNFIVGYPGETEDHHDDLLRFIEAAQLDWCGFFAYSREDGTYAADLDQQVPAGLMNERLAELTELQDAITASRRDDLIGTRVEVLVDRAGIGRSHREAPEIDGVVAVDESLPVGEFATVGIVDALGCDLIATGASDAVGDALDGI